MPHPPCCRRTHPLARTHGHDVSHRQSGVGLNLYGWGTASAVRAVAAEGCEDRMRDAGCGASMHAERPGRTQCAGWIVEAMRPWADGRGHGGGHKQESYKTTIAGSGSRWGLPRNSYRSRFFYIIIKFYTVRDLNFISRRYIQYYTQTACSEPRPKR